MFGPSGAPDTLYVNVYSEDDDLPLGMPCMTQEQADLIAGKGRKFTAVYTLVFVKAV